MAQTITPVVHGGSRRRWAAAVTLHVLGAGLSAAILGAGLGAIGSLAGAPWGRAGMLLVGAMALAYASREILRLPVPIPEMRRQVPEWWRGVLGPRTVAFLYGVALGPGFATHLRHGTWVVVAAIAAALGDPWLGVLLLAPFGVARAFGVALASAGRTQTAVMGGGERLERLGAGVVPRVTNAVALLVMGAVAAFSTSAGASPGFRLWPMLVAVTFAWAAAAKVIRREEWREAVRLQRLPRPFEALAEPLVPLSEATVVVLLLLDRVRAGAALAVVLLAAFSLALLRARRLGDGRLPCGCFGGRARRSVPWLLSRNALLVAVAAAAMTRPAEIPLQVPGTEEALPAFLTVGGVVLAAALARTAAAVWTRQEIRTSAEPRLPPAA